MHAGSKLFASASSNSCMDENILCAVCKCIVIVFKISCEPNKRHKNKQPLSDRRFNNIDHE